MDHGIGMFQQASILHYVSQQIFSMDALKLLDVPHHE